MTDAWLDGLDTDPRVSLAAWLEEARAADVHEPEAAALATATPDGRPSVRMVLVRGVDEHDLRFYTNHDSRKAGELRANAPAALCFYWGPPLRRQVRVEGRVERLTDELGAIIDAVSKVAELDLADVPPTSHPLDLVNAWADDEPHESLPVDAVFANAPGREGDLFKVPPTA